MCFDLSWNTRLFVIFMKLWFSQRIIVVSNSTSNSIDISFWSHIALQLAEQAAMYYASAVLRATLDFFLLNHEILADTKQ